MKRNALVTLVALVSLAIGAGTAYGAEYKIKYAHPAPPSDPGHISAQRFAKLIAERTNNQVEVTIFPGSQLGKSQQVVQGLQSGAIEMAFFSTTHLVNFVPQFGVLDLPFLVTKQSDASKLLDGEIGQSVLTKLPAIGLVGLAYSESSFRSVFTKKPVDSLDELKGLKLRVPNSPVYVGTVKAMGALPTPIPFRELYSALQQGVVDGAETSGSAYWSYKFYEVGKHWIITNHTILPGVYLISKKFWDKLPADIQKTIKMTAVEVGLFHRKLSWEQDTTGLERAKKNGVKVHNIGDLSPVIKKARAIYPELAKKIGPDLVRRAVALFQ
jgi:tripartite ATP-independent transporter DctP family solute receptor